MKPAVQVLFLLLYTLSSYGTAQSRVVDVIDEVQHARTDTAGSAVHNACKGRLNYTHFREAKRSAVEYTFSSPALARFCQTASFRRFVPQTISLRLQSRVENSAPRAPPAVL